jgi:hypothetical protein
MDKKISDIIFKGKASKAKKLVDSKIKEIEKKHDNYMKENNLELSDYYKFNLNDHSWEFGITNKAIAQSDFARELEKEVISILSDHSR